MVGTSAQLGAGLMGAGIAQVSAAQGKYNVIIKVCVRRDISPIALA
jgi:3-hydroxyacyl-CoA dehydrogenase